MIELRVPEDAPEGTLTQVKLIAAQFPGDHRLTLVIPAGELYPGGPRAEGFSRLTLGPEWTYDASGPCLAALGEFGTAVHVDR